MITFKKINNIIIFFNKFKPIYIHWQLMGGVYFSTPASPEQGEGRCSMLLCAGNTQTQCCSCHATQQDGVLPDRFKRQQSPAGPVNMRRNMRCLQPIVGAAKVKIGWKLGPFTVALVNHSPARKKRQLQHWQHSRISQIIIIIKYYFTHHCTDSFVPDRVHS